MGICNIKQSINVKENIYFTPKECRQNDTLILDLTVWDGSILADISGWSCQLKANKNNGMGFQVEEVEVNATNSNIHIKSENTLTQFGGPLALDFCFTKDGLQKTAFTIVINVICSVMGNVDGTVPECIITALQKLDENLAKLSEAITACNSAKGEIDLSTNTAKIVNTTLITNTNKANISLTNLSNCIDEAKETIQELLKANNKYTDHINNTHIHITEEERNNWNNSAALIKQLSDIISDLTIGLYVDENDDYYADENGDYYEG